MKLKKLTTTQIIAIGFALAILLGALLLMLPFATVSGESVGFVDALFMSATSICVTGLTTVTTATHWSMFGKIVILVLIQLGGLGVITVMLLVLSAAGRRMTIKERMLVQDTYNLNGLDGTGSLIRRIARGVLLAEALGALCYAFVFIPEFGLAKGLWQSVFLSVSAFCNAGIDILGEASLSPYVHHIWINLVTMTLIVMGGLGFLVWWDLKRGGRRLIERKKGRGVWHTFFDRLRLHTKVVLLATLGMILLGTVLVFIFEHDNPATLGGMSLGEKWLASLFQSVTYRTAGFFTIPQGELTGGSLLLSYLWMLIGGSPAGTAGGIKTTTAALILLCVISAVKGEQESVVFGRSIPRESIKTALTVAMLGVIAVFVGSMILCMTESFALEDILFETVSAIGTVGLSRGITAALSTAGKLVIIVLMFMGRIGPITLAMALAAQRRKFHANIRHPEERILIG